MTAPHSLVGVNDPSKVDVILTSEVGGLVGGWVKRSQAYQRLHGRRLGWAILAQALPSSRAASERLVFETRRRFAHGSQIGRANVV